jgi:hypothetical protein
MVIVSPLMICRTVRSLMRWDRRVCLTSYTWIHHCIARTVSTGHCDRTVEPSGCSAVVRSTVDLPGQCPAILAAALLVRCLGLWLLTSGSTHRKGKIRFPTQLALI